MASGERTWVVDAIEDGTAAVEEDGARMIRVPLWLLPAGTREGDVLRVRRHDEDGACVLRIEPDRAATDEARARAAAQLARLREHDASGDIALRSGHREQSLTRRRGGRGGAEN